MQNLAEQNPVELEVKLIVCSEYPKKVFSKIADLTSIDNYLLIPQKAILLHDVYWDTRDRLMQKNRVSLRTRSVNSRQFITVKGEADVKDWGAVQRSEMEEIWSKEGYEKVVPEFTKIGIKIPKEANIFNIDSPKSTFQNLGFVAIQDRKTERIVRNIIATDKQTVLAELVLDAVHYNIHDQALHHFELEIESKHTKGQKTLQTILDFFINKYQSEIKIWTHSKLAIGIALEKLIKRQTWDKYVNKYNHLLPSTYERISEILISNKM